MNVTDLASNALADAIKNQPWYKRYSGVVTGVLSALVALATWALTVSASLPTWATTAIGVALVVGTGVAQRLTPNGITPRGTRNATDIIRPVIEAAEAFPTARAERKLDEVLKAVTSTGGAVATGADELIARAKDLGLSDHDPRFLGLTAEQAARDFLQQYSGRHRSQG